MLKHYLKNSLMLLGMAAVATTAQAGAYRDVTTQYITDPAYVAGWQGAITAVGDGVGEVFNGAFNLYQTLRDMPAGEYTLKADAFYRCGNNDYSKANMSDGKNHYAYIYINGEKKTIKGLFDGRDTAPNGTGEANAAFEAGEYANEVTINFEGGDMVIGICNEGGYNDEWCCFDNFKLFNGTTEVTDKIVNGDFASGITFDAYDFTNAETKVKKPDTNKNGGVYRKTNASPYNGAQQVELPAGKYRYSFLTFHRYGGAGNFNGKFISCKNAFGLQDGKSPKDWFDGNEYETNDEYNHAYIYMSKNETKPANLDYTEDFGELTEDQDLRVRIKDCWELNNGDYAAMPENETRANADGTEIVPDYATRNVVPGWGDSGSERESAAAFVLQPEKYRQCLEFELTAPTKVWLGLGKNSNTGDQYWHPWADQKLEMWDEGAGVDNVTADMEDADAPVEYFNLQGIRVANPENGIFIVKQGKKVSKQVIR